MADPIATVHLLEHLVKLGFKNEHFYLVHHFERESIKSHCKYCEEHPGQFEPDGTNEKLQRRLRIILNAYVFGGFTSKSVFKALAQASVAEVPID